MVEGLFGLRKLTEAPPVRIIIDEMYVFKEAHRKAIKNNPQSVEVNGHEFVIEDQGTTRVVTTKNG